MRSSKGYFYLKEMVVGSRNAEEVKERERKKIVGKSSGRGGVG